MVGPDRSSELFQGCFSGGITFGHTSSNAGVSACSGNTDPHLADAN